MSNGELPRPSGPDGDTLEALDPDQRKALASELSRTLLFLLRVLRARQGRATQPHEALRELYAGLTKLLERHGQIHLKVAIDGLYLGRSPVLAVSPKDDPALFRTFQHGIRQFTLLRGLPFDELETFVTVLSTDLKQVQTVEEDLSILLADREFAFIHFVVVETFSEFGTESRPELRTAELAEVVAASLRRTLSANPEILSKASGGTVRFWSADAVFFADDTVGALVAAMPRSPKGTPAGRPTDDEEIGALVQDLATSLRYLTPWLLDTVLGMMEKSSEDEASAFAQILGGQILADGRAQGLGAILPALERVVRWMRRGKPGSLPLAKAVFSRSMQLLALSALKDANVRAASAALLVLEHITSTERAKALAEVCILPASPVRQKAIDTLMLVESPPLREVTELIASVDPEAAAAVLDSLRDEPPTEERDSLFQAAMRHADTGIRARALRWIVRRGGDLARQVMREALYDPDELVRGAALYQMAERLPAYGGELIEEWVNSATFRKVEMDEKRRGTLVMVNLLGDTVAPQMRKLMRRFNVTGDQRIDELRAAAVVALGALQDGESKKKIAKLSRSRLCGPALQEEAKHVASAMKADRSPYPSALKSMRKIAVEVGYVEQPGEDEGQSSGDDLPRLSQLKMEPVPLPRSNRTTTPAPVSARHLRSTTPSPPEKRDSNTAPERIPSELGYGSRIEATRGKSARVSADVVEELLQGYSFDDIPVYGARSLGE